MPVVGDSPIVINVIAEDIALHQNSNPYRTSLGVSILKQVDGCNGIAAISLGNINMSLGGVAYNLDPVSIAFCNTEVAGVSVTVPYTATLTIATII